MARRSARLAMRPAVALLACEDPRGTRPPSQEAVDRYLQSRPGQSAALSTFIGFLKESKGIELSRASRRRTVDQRRLKLERRLAALVAEEPGASDYRDRWLSAALPYFHRLSQRDAARILKSAQVDEDNEGYNLKFAGKAYWVPAHPGPPPQAELRGTESTI